MAVFANQDAEIFAPLTLAIIGAGEAGRSLAAQALAAGHRVLLEDVLPSRLRRAQAEIAVPQTALELVGTVEDAVREADLVIDFVPDELESKLEIISMVDRMAPPKTVLCIPTGTLSINDLASCTYRADRSIAVQWSEGEATIICGPKTSEATEQIAFRFWRSLGYTCSVLQDAEAIP